MALNDLAANGKLQPQTLIRSAVGNINLQEGLENFFEEFFRNAGALILKPQSIQREAR